MKYCSKCKTEKDLSEFGVDKHEKDGHRYQCKKCMNARAREYASRNKDVIRARNKAKAASRQVYYQSPKGIESSRKAHLKRKYDITLEEYNILSEKQGHVCAICGSEEMNSKNKVLCVDHNHETNEIRGLLCGLCNSGIGNLKDSKELLINSIKYLEKYE